MDIYEIIKTRRSVRAYEDRPIPDDVLQRLLGAAQGAPSANNLQPWKLIVVRDAQRRQDLALAARQQMFIAEAPVVIAPVALDPEKVMTCEVPTYAVDAAIAIDHLTLAAAAEGLGTCWIGAYDQGRVRDILGVPEGQKVVILMPVGYPADVPVEKTRKSLEELVDYERLASL
jgi:nitroreductase